MVRLRTPSAVLAACLACCGCVVVPVTVEGYDPDCRVVTHHMELRSVQLLQVTACAGGDACTAGVLAGLGVTAASAIVSGSIVVAGNVIYWADHRANCPVPAAT